MKRGPAEAGGDSCAHEHGHGGTRSIDEALDLVLANAAPLPEEILALTECAGRVLASDVLSDVDVPPFDRVAMDGYALRAADVASVPATLELAGLVHAGETFRGRVDAGRAVKIMTGAPLPEGADAVVPVEQASDDGGRVTVREGVASGRHVSPRGEDLRAGTTVLSKGALVGPAEVALLATVGQARVRVHGVPAATVVSTGDELVEVGEVPPPGKIRNSNGPMLAALAASLGCEPVRLLPAVRDDEAELRDALRLGLESDVLFVSGGVSKGEKDHVGSVLESLGVRRVFHGVAIQPGKPLWFGRTERCLVFALPGNPVSALVTGRLFAGAAVARLRGVADVRPRLVPARLARAHSRHAGRTGYLPARVTSAGDGLACEPIASHGSADLTAAVRSNALWVAPAGRDRFEAGERVEVLLALDWARR